MYQKRIARLRQIMQESNLPAILIVSPENRYYMSGFSGSNAFLVITANQAVMITDFRYMEQAKAECPDYDVRIYNRIDLPEKINTILARSSIGELGFDRKVTTYADYQYFTAALTAKLIPYENLIEQLRAIKDDHEIEQMQQAQTIAEQAFMEILQRIQPGVIEFELATELEYQMKKRGALRCAFPSIVASGWRSALPHGRASHKIVERGDLITFDFGAFYGGYCSDMTRTIAVGSATPKQKEIYNIVLEAHLASLEACKPGVRAADIDKIAREIITDAGYGKYFGHGLGHGVGKMVHEAPAYNARSNDVLKIGHTGTIEPGIYIPDWGGVRIEDMILITADGYYNFNKVVPKNLLII